VGAEAEQHEEQQHGDEGEDEAEEAEAEAEEKEAEQQQEEEEEALDGVDYVLPRLPEGQTLLLRLLCTWGDRHYIGLNGLELFDVSGTRLRLGPDAVDAEPRSINELPEIQNDPRTPDKLLDGCNATRDDGHMWLAPWTQGQTVTVTVRLPERVRLSLVRLWNYGKTPSRGAKQVELELDGVLLYAGYVRCAPPRLGVAEEEGQVCAALAFAVFRCGHVYACTLCARSYWSASLARTRAAESPIAPVPLRFHPLTRSPLAPSRACEQEWCQSLVLSDDPALNERERAFVYSTGAHTGTARAQGTC
jgi:hypothetical protein